MGLHRPHGKRKAKKVGSREAAEKVKREIEARLALGGLGFLSADEKPEITTFADYAKKWTKRYAEVECKYSTVYGYKRLLERHLKPKFGHLALDEISREHVKDFDLVGLRAGLRRGEIVALQWGDIQFGADESDPNRFIEVNRNYVYGRFTTPKNHRSRRVDMSLELRRTLLELRDARLLEAFAAGKSSIAEEFVFPSKSGGVVDPDHMIRDRFLPTLQTAGIRAVRFHDLRHTFARC